MVLVRLLSLLLLPLLLVLSVERLFTPSLFVDSLVEELLLLDVSGLYILTEFPLTLDLPERLVVSNSRTLTRFPLCRSYSLALGPL